MEEKIYFYDDIASLLDSYAKQEGIEEMVDRVLVYLSIKFNLWRKTEETNDRDRDQKGK